MAYIIRKSSVSPTSSITGRKYPDGEPIPDSLPGIYKPSHRCDDCGAYRRDTRYCITWGAIVRPDYVCASWVPIRA